MCHITQSFAYFILLLLLHCYLTSTITAKVMSGRSVNLTTLFLGRLRPPRRLSSMAAIFMTAVDQNQEINGANLDYAFVFICLPHTVEFQWLEHLWDHEKCSRQG